MQKTLSLLIIFCLFSCASVPRAKDYLFTSVPSQLSNSEARKAVQIAALNRNWIIKENTPEKLEIELKHRNYHAVLCFTFSDDIIRYSDHSTYFSTVSNSHQLRYSDDDEGRWIKRNAKKNWIDNLKHDANQILKKMVVEKDTEPRSIDSVSEKLISLKNLYEQNLITEIEYQKKREEILSVY